jgi:2-oxoisovalerate dehydrogenase E1 component
VNGRIVDLFREMQRIRVFEETVIRLFKASEFSGFLHTGIGQEAIAVGVCGSLQAEDWLTATHRSHGHLLARGVPMHLLLAEIYGKESGLCEGVAGHVHVADMTRRIVGGNGVLGQNQPIATGLALGLRLRRESAVVVSIFGDGTANEGAVHEAMNLAAIWELPVLFVCERNEFSELSPYTSQFKIKSVADRAAAYGFEGYSLEGTDVEAVGELVQRLTSKMRRGGGPALVELRVVRWHGHYEGDPQQYRDAALRPSADPLQLLTESHPELLGQEVRESILTHAREEMEAAIRFARQGSHLDPEALFARAADTGVPP